MAQTDYAGYWLQWLKQMESGIEAQTYSLQPRGVWDIMLPLMSITIDLDLTIQQGPTSSRMITLAQHDFI